uniref:MYND-type domain-containing protein n=1 Tax=Ciona savignyi TaxID=51511 RepID=H2ZD12_CIOSA
KYSGEFVDDMRHGTGSHTWKSGEVYEGSFYKDHMHGNGCYTWRDGSTFTGSFYLDQKQGYGTLTFVNGDVFEGLYKANERFGPGVLTYAGHGQCKVQDIGWWCRDKLIRLCTRVEGAFSMHDHKEYKYFEEETHHQIDLSENESSDLFAHNATSYSFLSEQFKAALSSESTVLPNGIEIYSKDYEHLPQTSKLKKELNQAFFGADYDLVCSDKLYTVVAINNTPLSMKIQKHIHTHRHQEKGLSFIPDEISTKERSFFDSKSGPLEHASRQLLLCAGAGDAHSVYSILKSGAADPNVADRQGNNPIISAATNCHLDVVNILLDMGANINQVNDQGTSSLSACHVFYYPVDHFKTNLLDQIHAKHPEYGVFEKPKTKKRESIKRRSSSISSKVKNRRESSPSPAPSDDSVSLLDGIGATEGIEICKSDLKSRSAEKKPKKTKSSKVTEENSVTQDGSSSSDVLHQIFLTEELAFESNENVVDLDAKVTQDLIERTATLLSYNERAVSGVSTRNGQAIRLGTTGALAVWKAEHSQLRKTIELLLLRGADPNIGPVPFPPLFFAVKAADISAVCLLLNKGASTAFRLSDKGLGGFNVLHVASGIMCSEGVKLVELLLHANADPNTCAHDRYGIYNKMHTCEGTMTLDDMHKNMDSMGLSEDLGITALHIACHRDDNYKDACDVTHLLLNNAAKPDCIWTGHSPLSLAIASGNDLCVKKLLQFGADASLELSDGLGSALCVASDPQYEFRRSPEDRISLIDWLVKFGADMLAPIKFGSKQSTGTVVDYAHWLFNKDTRISRTPYHALNIKEREAYNARKNLLTHLGKLLRESAKNLDRRTTQENFSGSTENGLYPHETDRDDHSVKYAFELCKFFRKPAFKYCYECGRSVGVHLTSCTRCHEVYYCSRACKLKAWEERHKYEC